MIAAHYINNETVFWLYTYTIIGLINIFFMYKLSYQIFFEGGLNDCRDFINVHSSSFFRFLTSIRNISIVGLTVVLASCGAKFKHEVSGGTEHNVNVSTDYSICEDDEFTTQEKLQCLETIYKITIEQTSKRGVK